MIHVIYKKNLSKNFTGNLILFVNEKFNVFNLKKYLSLSEYNFVSDLLKTKNKKKNISFRY